MKIKPSLISAIIIVLTFVSNGFAAVPMLRPGLNIDESLKIISLPYQYYYLEEVKSGENEGLQQLHCYYPKTEVDVALDYHFLTSNPRIADIWYDKATESVYFVEDQGGELQYFVFNKINRENEISEVMVLEGMRPCAINGYSNYYLSWWDRQGDIIIIHDSPKSDNGGEKYEVYDLSLRPTSVPYPSKMEIKPEREVKYVKVTADGVNIRRAPTPNAPKLGYWRCLECEGSDAENPLAWENERKNETPPFTTWHPEKGYRFKVSDYAIPSEEWCGVDVDVKWQSDIAYISSKFVEDDPVLQIKVDEPLSDEWLQNRVMTVRDGKYKGMWVYCQDEGMDQARMILVGKIVNKEVVFYAYISNLVFDDFRDIVKTVKLEGDDIVIGKERLKEDEWGNYSIDLSKFTEPEFDMIFKKAKMTDPFNRPTIKKFANGETVPYY